MAKQAKPKVSELVEILIQQMDEFQTVTKERNEVLIYSISKLQNIKVDFNVDELEAMKQSNREILKNNFDNIHDQIRKNNKEWLRVHRKINYNKLLYISVFNILIFLSTSSAIFLSIKNSTENSELENLVIERNKLKNQVEHVVRYFSENQEAGIEYKNWLEN